MLDAALDARIRYVDAARSYGRAEEFLGSWLRARGARVATVAVGSKWGYRYTAGWRADAETHEVKEHTLPVLRRQIEESRSFLGDRLGLYQIHSATLESGVFDRHDVLEELARLRDGGLAIGFTASGPGQADTIRRGLEIAIGEAPLFSAVQSTWNLLEPSAGAALAEAHAAGLGVIVKEGLANGRLTARNASPGFGRRREVLERVAARLGATIDAVALAAILDRPWADVVLSGAATPAHLRSNLAASSVRLDHEARAALDALREPPPEYWATRSGLAWN
jgi:aryl-alcohol dehydrogenase-like predicted oxidoreductase